MSRPLARWLKSLTSRVTAPIRRDRTTPRTRLGLEPLEDRSVPATHTWIGGSTLGDGWIAPDNWQDFSPPTTGESGGTLVVLSADSTQDITGLVVDSITFANTTPVTLTLTTPLGLDASSALDQITANSGDATITGSSLDLTGSNATFVTVGDGFTVTIDSQITGSQGLAKFDAGNLVLSGANTYTGATEVNEGRLGVAGSLASSAVTVNDGVLEVAGTVGDVTVNAGFLIGSGTAGAVTVGTNGQVDPAGGDAIGTLTTGSLVLGGGYLPDVDATTADTISASSVNLTGSTLTIFSLATPTAASYTLINNTGTGDIVGTFNGLDEGATVTVGGVDYTISYAGGDGNDVVLNRVSPPTAPSGFSASLIDADIIFSWMDNSSDETAFEVEVTGPSGTTTTTVGANQNSLLVPGTPGQTFSGRVRAVNAAGQSAFSNTVSVTVPDTTAPTAPVNLRMVGTPTVSPATVTLTFDPSTDDSGTITSYILTPSTGSPITIPGNATTVMVSGLAPGSTTTFVLRATDAAGNNSLQSNILTVTIPSAPPAPPAPPTTTPSTTLAPPFYSSATKVGDNLVLEGAGVTGGRQTVPLPPRSTALFTDLNGDGRNDVVIITPALAVVVDGQTGRFLALASDVTGDGVRDLLVFNANGTTTTTNGRTGVTITQ